MVVVRDLSKRYGKHTALDGISFRVEKGEIVGFLGPNGAGKTTTMNIISGYISATEGTAAVAGHDVLESPLEVKRRIGYLPEAPPLYLDMTVQEYLTFAARIKRIRKAERSRELDSITGLVKIKDVRGRLIRNLSKGYRQRVGLAQALIGNPPVLILDEPTIGLDPKQIVEIRNLIRELGRERTIMLSSHILPEVTEICQRVLIIHHGRIVAEDTIENLSSSLGGLNRTSEPTRLTVRLAGGAEKALEICRSVGAVESARALGCREPGTVDLYIEGRKGRDIRPLIFHAMAEQGIPILMMRSADLTLEDIFIQLTAEQNGGS
jgi:ABC-2 type transport system ATP-binding protein